MLRRMIAARSAAPSVSTTSPGLTTSRYRCIAKNDSAMASRLPP